MSIYGDNVRQAGNEGQESTQERRIVILFPDTFTKRKKLKEQLNDNVIIISAQVCSIRECYKLVLHVLLVSCKAYSNNYS